MPEMMPPASLEPRDTDVALLPDQFKELSFFAQLKRAPDLRKYPGALILRFFRKGAVICRQGESGWSAFSILSDPDALKVLQLYRASGSPAEKKTTLDREIARLQGQNAGADQEAVSVFLAIPRRRSRKQGWLEQLTGLFSRSAAPAPKRPLYIPIDGPTDIPYDTRQATLRDGDLFGEMSSLYGTPRSATVVASRDLYVLEMLRHILDEVKRDEGFRKRMDETYRSRVLQSHLSGLAIFRDLALSEEQLVQLRQEVELLRFKDGDIICDENDRSDSLYIIRGGLVKVLKNASALLSVDDVLDWNKLAALLREGSEAGTSAPRSVLWKLLSPAGQALLQREPATLSSGDRQELVHALNDLIKKRELPDLKELQELAGCPRVAVVRPGTKKPAEWPDRDLRPFNRLLLEEALPGCLQGLKHGKGPATVLSFQGHGEFFGEMGLLLERPRSASCVAYVHPLPEGPGPQPVWLRQGDLVEMVRLPQKTFWSLIEANPGVRANVEKELARHQQADIRRLKERTWEAPHEVQSTERFSKLGLVQGQRLMLIDLDRCTRCDECVQACVNTHADGRSRLFLDGPRFGKYLVPTTCRSCLEPVCMIGCPVGSIHRGDNRQIVIEDWCIGCGLCARNCPYGSIQMHDIRLVPNEARGWHFLPAPAVSGLAWTQPGYADAHWLMGKAPFFDDPDLHTQLHQASLPASLPLKGGEADNPSPEKAVCFRREFQIGQEVARQAKEFKLEVISTDESAVVWINGQEIQTREKPKQNIRTFLIAGSSQVLRAGRNVVAVRVPNQSGKTLFDRDGNEVPLFNLRLDEVRAPVLPAGIAGDYTEKSYGELAVVCDLCSDQFGKRPACVTACPHDAALRIDARFEFPEQ